MSTLVPVEIIEKHILVLRNQKVMLSADLAELYGVEPKVLVQAVKRNMKRFPEDFMFQLTQDEGRLLRSQFVTLKKGRGQHAKYPAYAFTEQGIAMLSSVLNSDRAIAVNIEIMRAFVKLREMVASHKVLAKKLEELEKKYDAQFKVVFDAIHALLEPPKKPKRRISFETSEGQQTEKV
ncbi:MAG: ORF6N domain-containing protein [Syntrophorhabdus sp.]